MAREEQLLQILREALVRACMNCEEVRTITAEFAKVGLQVNLQIHLSTEPAKPSALDGLDVTALDAEFLRSMRIEPYP